MKSVAAVLLVVGLLVVPVGGVGAVPGRVLYVDAVSGSDARSVEEAESAATPWKTLMRAMQDVSAGDRLVTGSGSYELSVDGVSFDPPVTIDGGSGAQLAVLFVNSSGFTVVGFSYVLPTGISASSRITLRGGDHQGGVVISSGSSDVVLDGMRIHNVDDPDSSPYEKAVVVGGSRAAVYRVTIKNSVFENNPADSVHIPNGVDVVVVGNTFRNNGTWNATVDVGRTRHSDVMQVMGGSNIRFENNVVVGNDQVLMIKPNGDIPISNLVVRNNLFERNRLWTIHLKNVSNVILDSNVYICNGIEWKPACPNETQYDVAVKDGVTGLQRINDPANTTGGTTTTTTATTTTTTGNTTTTTTTGNTPGTTGTPGTTQATEVTGIDGAPVPQGTVSGGEKAAPGVLPSPKLDVSAEPRDPAGEPEPTLPIAVPVTAGLFMAALGGLAWWRHRAVRLRAGASDGDDAPTA